MRLNAKDIAGIEKGPWNLAVNTRLQIVQQDLERKTDQTTEDRVNQSEEGTYLNVLEDPGALEPSSKRW